MQPLNKTPRKKFSWSSIVLFISGLIAGIIITSFIKTDLNKSAAESSDHTMQLVQTKDSLQSRFYKLERLNERYASLLSDKNLDSLKLRMLDSLNMLITHTELRFLETLDNLQINNIVQDKTYSVLLVKITDVFRSSINTSNTNSTIRNSFNIGNTNYSFDQNMLNNMQNALALKETQVIELTGKLNNLKTAGTNKPDINLKNETQQQDSIIKTVLLDQKRRNENLISYNDKLKRENDRLKIELNNMSNAGRGNQSEVQVSTGLTKEEMNEQVNLARVDCFLSRADAAQIISNAKQRKDLLENALQILNTLSKSNNGSVRQQAQSKLSELKTIAANNHD